MHKPLSRPVAQMCPTPRGPPRQTQLADKDATYSERAHNCRNLVFKRHFPIHKIFERSCEIGLWRLTANRISEIFAVRLNQRLRGKLATVLDQIEHGHHVFRAYWKNAFLKQYEKVRALLAQ